MTLYVQSYFTELSYVLPLYWLSLLIMYAKFDMMEEGVIGM